MEELNRTSSQTDYAGLTLWDLRSDADDLKLTEFQNQIQVKLERECDSFAAGPGPRARDDSLGQQILDMAIKKEPSLSKDKLHECQSTLVNIKEHYGSFDESLIDNEGWFVNEQDKYGHGRGESKKDGPIITKRPFGDLNLESSGKIINLADFTSTGLGGVSGQKDTIKRRKHGHGIITTTSSQEISSQNPNVASDPKFSCNSVGQIGSMSLHAYHQQSNGYMYKRQRSSDIINIQLPNGIPDQSQRHFRNILDKAVRMADEAILNRVSAGNAPSKYVCKSYVYSQAKTMVPSQGKSDDTCIDKTIRTMVANERKSDDHDACIDKTKLNNSDVKQKPRPSERARILRRIQPKAKPTQGDNRTFLALIPVGTPNSETAKVHQNCYGRDAKKIENKMKSKRNVRKLLPKPSQAELKEAQAAQPVSQVAVPDQLIGGPSNFRHIAPKPRGPASIVVPVFEIVPVKPTTEQKPHSRPKNSSSRRKQDPLSAQTRGEKWRLEESEIIVEESQEEEEKVKRNQNLVDLMLNNDEEEEDDEEDQDVDLIWDGQEKVEEADDDDEEAGAEEEGEEWQLIKCEVNTDDEDEVERIM